MCVDEKKCVHVSVKFPRRARRATNSFKSNDEQCYQEWRHPRLFNKYSWLVRGRCEVVPRFGRVGALLVGYCCCWLCWKSRMQQYVAYLYSVSYLRWFIVIPTSCSTVTSGGFGL